MIQTSAVQRFKEVSCVGPLLSKNFKISHDFRKKNNFKKIVRIVLGLGVFDGHGGADQSVDVSWKLCG